MGFHCLGFLLGVGLFWGLPELPSTPWMLALLVLVPGLAWRPRVRRLLGPVLGFLWAWFCGWLTLAWSLPPDAEVNAVSVEGEIVGLPVSDAEGLSLTLRLRCFAGQDLAWYQSAALRLRARQWHGSPPRSGESWHFQVRLRRPHLPLDPGADDGERQAFVQGIRAFGSLTPASARRLAPASPASLAWIREAARERLRTALSGRSYAGVVLALVMGDESGIDDTTWRIFRRTGTAHLVAISGAHITLLAGAVFFLVNAGWRRFSGLCLVIPASQAGVASGLAAAVAYAGLAGFGIPVQRALVMLLVLGICRLQRRVMAASSALLISAAGVVLWEPTALLSAGFWLSFVAVAFIFWWLSTRRERSWKQALGLQLLLSLGLAPLLLFWFQQTSLVSPLANLVFGPVVEFLVLPLALGGLFLIPLWPWAGEALVRLSETLLSLSLPCLEALGRMPGAVLDWPSLSRMAVLAASLGMFLGFAPRGFPLRRLAPLLCFPMLGEGLAQPESAALVVTVLDVGQGLSTVVATKRHILVFDAGFGMPGGYSAGERLVAPFLRAKGYRVIDRLVVSHGDADHAGGVPGLRRELSVVRIQTSVPGRIPGAQRCVAGEHWSWDGVDFEFLSPADEDLSGNDASCVLRVRYREHVLLLTGDIEAPAERRLLARYGRALAAEILVAPHHGSAGSSSPDFVAAVHPSWVVYPVGYRNRFGFPRAITRSRYQRLGAREERTDEGGAIAFRFDAGLPVRISRYRELRPAIWRER